MSMQDVPRAPITDRQRDRLRRDLKNIEAVAKRKGFTLAEYDERFERLAGEHEFELGCWFWWAERRQFDRSRRYKLSIDDRASVVYAMLVSGRTAVGYEFFTVFNFGERTFDAFFEMGDGEEVVREVVKRVRASGHPVAIKGLTACGWDDPRYATPNSGAATGVTTATTQQQEAQPAAMAHDKDELDSVQASLRSLGFGMEFDLGSIPGEGHHLIRLDTGQAVDLDEEDVPEAVLDLAREWSRIADARAEEGVPGDVP